MRRYGYDLLVQQILMFVQKFLLLDGVLVSSGIENNEVNKAMLTLMKL